MKRSNSNPTTTLTKRRSFRGWLKRVTLPNGTQRKVGPDDSPKGGVFGIPLTMSIKYAKTTVGYVDEDNVKHTKAGAIPIVVAKCGSYLKKNALETEGIFRISGSVKRVNALEFQFDQSSSSYGLDLNWEGYTVHDAASLLRRYLNKLPDPVIPFAYYQEFRDVMSNNTYRDTEQRIEEFQKLIQSLPPPHQHLLLYLLDTLNLFSINAAETKMDIPNLAAVFCPGILRHPDHNNPIQYKISQYVIEFLIEFQSLFTMQLLVPSKKKKMSSGEVPPVPLLLPSSSKQQNAISQPPAVPLHVVNPTQSSLLSSKGSSSVTNSSFIESPLDIDQKERHIPSDETTTTKESFMHNVTKVSRECYHAVLKKLDEFRHAIEPFVAKPAALLICFSILLVTLIVIVYEAYLAVTLVSFEPLIFFSGLASYWGLLYGNLSANGNEEAIAKEKEEKEREAIEEDDDEDVEAMYPVMDAATEKEMMQDESIMSEWRDLLTRAWKVTEAGDKSSSSAASIIAGDGDMSSILSRSSRFNEEEDFAPPPTGSISSTDEDDDDEELGFDPDTLEMYLSQYDQIKKDAQLAKQLQEEEHKARDENNPFVVDSMAVGKKPPAINTTKQIDMKNDRDRIITPTSADKEEWKIRVFPRQ